MALLYGPMKMNLFYSPLETQKKIKPQNPSYTCYEKIWISLSFKGLTVVHLN